jgi:dolichol-phosphate mannosyltransferase
MEQYSSDSSKTQAVPLLSVVIPAYNEELSIQKSIPAIHDAIWQSSLFITNPYIFEVIVVDDGSTDSTVEQMTKLALEYPNLRLISLYKNYGHMIALENGLAQSRGQYICTIDADLQDPPEYIPIMLLRALTGKFDVIQGVRPERRVDSFFKRNSASIFYKIIGSITDINVVAHAADFRLLTREATNSLLSSPERGKVFRLLIPYYGYKTDLLIVPREKRVAGESKYPLRKMLALGLDSAVRFSSKPLRAVSLIGMASSLLLIIGAAVTFVLWLSTNLVAGWTSIVLLILATNALILFGLGVIAEYLGRTYENSLNRNTNLIREKDLYAKESE